MVRVFADQTAICQLGQVVLALSQLLNGRQAIILRGFILRRRCDEFEQFAAAEVTGGKMWLGRCLGAARCIHVHRLLPLHGGALCFIEC